jgi:hypothetical protein
MSFFQHRDKSSIGQKNKRKKFSLILFFLFILTFLLSPNTKTTQNRASLPIRAVLYSLIHPQHPKRCLKRKHAVVQTEQCKSKSKGNKDLRNPQHREQGRVLTQRMMRMRSKHLLNLL